MSRYALTAGDRRVGRVGAPELRDERRRRVHLCDVVPADGPLAGGADQREVLVLERGIVGRGGRLCLVAADVDERAGGQRGQLVEHVLLELVGDVLVDAQ
jgi:hypothetical protein